MSENDIYKEVNRAAELVTLDLAESEYDAFQKARDTIFPLVQEIIEIIGRDFFVKEPTTKAEKTDYLRKVAEDLKDAADLIELTFTENRAKLEPLLAKLSFANDEVDYSH